MPQLRFFIMPCLIFVAYARYIIVMRLNCIHVSFTQLLDTIRYGFSTMQICIIMFVQVSQIWRQLLSVFSSLLCVCLLWCYETYYSHIICFNFRYYCHIQIQVGRKKSEPKQFLCIFCIHLFKISILLLVTPVQNYYELIKISYITLTMNAHFIMC